jgi:hypothetical protein
MGLLCLCDAMCVVTADTAISSSHSITSISSSSAVAAVDMITMTMSHTMRWTKPFAV